MRGQTSLNEIRDTAKLIAYLTKKLSSSGIYPVSIPEGSSIRNLLAAGHFSLTVGPELAQKENKMTDDKNESTIVFVKLFSLPMEIVERVLNASSCRDFVNELILPFLRNRKGYRHIGIAELLALAAQYPELQKSGQIIGFGRGFKWDDENEFEPIKYPRLTAIQYPDRASRVFDWLIHIRPEELSTLRFAMVVK